jgi:hypothetical protein
MASEFFALSIIASESKARLFNGIKTISAPALFDALSYSQNVGKGIITFFLTKVRANLWINSVAPFPTQIHSSSKPFSK